MLLLHTCCASCALSYIEALQKEMDLTDQDITIFFSNPNLHPRSEYFARQKAVKVVFESRKCKLVFPNYKPAEYFAMFAHPPQIGDKNNRCPKCWTLRLSSSFEYARQNGYQAVGSTMVTSAYMDQVGLRKIAQNLSQKYKIPFLIPQKIDCHQKRCGFYIQNYCGCMYSLVEKNYEKYF